MITRVTKYNKKDGTAETNVKKFKTENDMDVEQLCDAMESFINDGQIVNRHRKKLKALLRNKDKKPYFVLIKEIADKCIKNVEKYKHAVANCDNNNN